MQLLKEIKDNNYPIDKSIIKNREASRAILFDESNLIPLLFVSKYNYYKLPGGGIDEDENKEQALIRECLEEVGSKIKTIGKVGKVIEFRSKGNFKQTSYCYYGKIITKGKPDFTEKELEQGFEIVWMTLKEAILKVKNSKPENYAGGFIQKRDLVLLEKTEQIIENK